MNLFVDTSALVKLYHREPGTDSLLKFLYLHAENLILTIADITRIEFRSALLRRVRTGEFSRESAKQVFEAFDTDLKLFNLVDVDANVKEAAVQLLDSIALQNSLRTLDALQLSAAIVSSETISIDAFITCDRRLLEIAKPYFQTFNPETEISLTN